MYLFFFLFCLRRNRRERLQVEEKIAQDSFLTSFKHLPSSTFFVFYLLGFVFRSFFLLKSFSSFLFLLAFLEPAAEKNAEETFLLGFRKTSELLSLLSVVKLDLTFSVLSVPLSSLSSLGCLYLCLHLNRCVVSVFLLSLCFKKLFFSSFRVFFTRQEKRTNP